MTFTPDHIATLRLRYATPKPGREDMLAALDEIKRLQATLADIEEYGTDEASAAVELRSKLAAMTMECDHLRATIKGWSDRLSNEAMLALLEGRAAVVPLICPEGEHYGELTEVLYVGASPTFYPTPLLLSTVRLDKPREGE